MWPVPSTLIFVTTIDKAGLHASAFGGLACVYTLCHTHILRRVAGRGAPVASLCALIYQLSPFTWCGLVRFTKIALRRIGVLCM